MEPELIMLTLPLQSAGLNLSKYHQLRRTSHLSIGFQRQTDRRAFSGSPYAKKTMETVNR